MKFDRDLIPCEQFDGAQDFLTTFIVLGPGHSSKVANHAATPGRIKCVKFSKHTDSPMLAIKWKEKGGRRVGVDSLHLSGSEEKMGSRFLRDIYRDEGRLDDYRAFVARERAAAMGRKVGPLPDEYLPKLVLEWRAAEAQGEDVFELPPKGEPAAESVSGPSPAFVAEVNAALASRSTKPARRRPSDAIVDVEPEDPADG